MIKSVRVVNGKYMVEIQSNDFKCNVFKFFLNEADAIASIETLIGEFKDKMEARSRIDAALKGWV